MSDYRFCLGCSNAMPPEKFSDYHEYDVNWHGLQCECGAIDEFEEMDPTWALEQIRRAYQRLRQSGDSDLGRLSDRLSAAEDELKAALHE